MERTKKVVKAVEEVEILSPQYRWRKLGGGALHLNNRIIKPGQVFVASPEEIPKAFLDLVECLDRENVPTAQIVKEAKMQEVSKPENIYEIVPIEGEETFNVVNTVSGKPINEEPLTSEEAEELKTALEA